MTEEPAGPRYAVNCSILFTELPVLQRPRAARAAGFEAIEFWWPFFDPVPGDAEVDAFATAVTDAGVRLTGLNFAAGDMAAGDRGLLSDPVARSVFRDSVDVAAAIADRLGVGAFNALYGNRRDGLDPDVQDDIAVENLEYAASAVADFGATVLIEPLSGVPAYPLRTADEVIAVLDRVADTAGDTSLRLLADFYHLHVNGEDLAVVIDRHGDRIGHVQIADAPGRGAPGTGAIDFSGHLAQLAGRGYRGHIGLEYRPGEHDPFGWLPFSQRRLNPWDHLG